MKTLISLFVILSSLSAFAQDTYHAYEKVTCGDNESCLVNPKHDFVIKGIDIENRAGEKVGMRLSSESNIADTAYTGVALCYKGEASEVCGLLNLMNYDEGHAMISNFSCFIMNDGIKLGYDVEYDMGPGVETVRLSIKKCE